MACVAALGPAAPLPRVPAVRLGEPVEIAVGEFRRFAAAVVDNETVALVGTTAGLESTGVGDPPAGALVNVRTKMVTPFTNGHTAHIRSVAPAKDGTLIATCSDGKEDRFVRLWDVKAGKPRPPLALPAGRCGAADLVALPRTGRIAVELDGKVGLFDPAGKAPRADLTADALEDSCIWTLAADRDEKYLACSTVMGQIVAWNLDTDAVAYIGSLLPKPIDRPRGRDDPPPHMYWYTDLHAFTRDGRLLATRTYVDYERATADVGWPEYHHTREADVPAVRRSVFEIDVRAKTATPLGIGHPRYVDRVALHPSDEWLVTFGMEPPDRPVPGQPGAMESVLRVYHYPTRTMAYRFQFPHDREFSPVWFGFTPDGKKLVAVDVETKVMAWDFAPIAP